MAIFVMWPKTHQEVKVSALHPTLLSKEDSYEIDNFQIINGQRSILHKKIKILKVKWGLP